MSVTEFSDRCGIVGCERSVGVVRVGMCRKHYSYHWRHDSLPAGTRPPNAHHRVSEGESWCSGCRQVLPKDRFHRRLRGTNGVEHYCKSCAQERRMGLSHDEYDALLRRQGGGCAICGVPPSSTRLHIDHDHDCCPANRCCGRCIRGLLCGSCNRALGLLGDDTDKVLACALYLERTQRVSH